MPQPGHYSCTRPSHTGAIAMPIATPEIYAQMLDRAKQQGFAYPAINVTSSQTLNAALKGFADAESDGIVQISTGGAEYLSGQSVKDMVTGADARSPSSPTWSRRSTPSTSRCTPTTARRTSSTATCARWSRSPPSGSARARSRCSSRTCGTARRCRSPRTSRSPRTCSAKCAAGQDHHGARDRRRRRRGRRRRRRDQREAVLHAGRRPGDGGGPRHSASAAGTSSPRPSATCTASTSRGT